MRHLPRSLLRHLLLLSVGMWLHGCGVHSLAPSATSVPRVAPAVIARSNTPAEAMQRFWKAFATGDETLFRECVMIDSPYGYSEGYVRWCFASQRLHRAIFNHSVTGKRILTAGFDTNERLANTAGLVTEGIYETQRRAYEQIVWTTEGDIALADGERLTRSTWGEQSVERHGGNWIVVIREPKLAKTGDPSAKTLRRYGESWKMMATAMDEAAAEVKAGRLKTFLQVNEFVTAKSNELAGQSPILRSLLESDALGR